MAANVGALGVSSVPGAPEVVSSELDMGRDFSPAELTTTAQAVPAGYLPPAVNNSNVTNVHTHVNVGGPNILVMTKKSQVPFILRALWFVAVGWWLSAVFIVVGYVCALTIILAPIGFWFLNRVPQAQTLRMRSEDMRITQRDGMTVLSQERAEQLPWYVRALYFPFGLAFGLAWLTLAWFISLLIITLPLSVWMIDRSPTIISLQRN